MFMSLHNKRYGRVILIALIFAMAQSVDASDPRADLVLQAMAVNGERLGAVELSLVKEQIPEGSQTGPQGPSTVEEELPDGGVIVMTKPQHTSSRRRVVINAEFVQVSDARDGQEASLWQYETGKWLEYRPDLKLANYRTSEHLPGIPSLNPLDVETFNVRRPLREMLSTLPFSKYDDTNPRYIRITMSLEDGGQLEVTFDKSIAILPTSSTLISPAGKSIRETTAEYQEVPDRHGWLLKKATVEWKPDISHLPVGSDTMLFTGRQVTTVESFRLLDDTEFKIAKFIVPEGVRVVDVGALRDTPESPRPMNVAASSNWHIWANVAVIVVLLVLIGLRMRRS